MTKIGCKTKRREMFKTIVENEIFNNFLCMQQQQQQQRGVSEQQKKSWFAQ